MASKAEQIISYHQKMSTSCRDVQQLRRAFDLFQVVSKFSTILQIFLWDHILYLNSSHVWSHHWKSFHRRLLTPRSSVFSYVSFLSSFSHYEWNHSLFFRLASNRSNRFSGISRAIIFFTSSPLAAMISSIFLKEKRKTYKLNYSLSLSFNFSNTKNIVTIFLESPLWES